jgi:hypothetical protein
VVGVPDVAAANSGYKVLAVVVSLAIEAPAVIVTQEVSVPFVVKYLPVLEV